MVSNLSLENKHKLLIEILPKATKQAFLACQKLKLFNNSQWYLAGGTALALQVGHRQSVDLDFFTTASDFNREKLERQLIKTKKWRTTYTEEGTLYGEFYGAKMSFIAYPFFKPLRKRINAGSVKILTASDIAVMKIIAISQRGRKRDFFDLYWYCQNKEPLTEIILRVAKQYPGQEHNINHILKSLLYFADAEKDPMPKIFFSVTWPRVKRFFQKEVLSITHFFF